MNVSTDLTTSLDWISVVTRGMLVIQERRDNPTDKQDLLNIMLNCEDKKKIGRAHV